MAANPEERPHAPRGILRTQPARTDRGWLLNGNPPGDPSRAPRCGARTRAGSPCKAPRIRGRPRCRMHGGALGSGAPVGNLNAWKHGEYGARAIIERRAARLLLTSLKGLRLG